MAAFISYLLNMENGDIESEQDLEHKTPSGDAISFNFCYSRPTKEFLGDIKAINKLTTEVCIT